MLDQLKVSEISRQFHAEDIIVTQPGCNQGMCYCGWVWSFLEQTQIVHQPKLGKGILVYSHYPRDTISKHTICLLWIFCHLASCELPASSATALFGHLDAEPVVGVPPNDEPQFSSLVQNKPNPYSKSPSLKLGSPLSFLNFASSYFPSFSPLLPMSTRSGH